MTRLLLILTLWATSVFGQTAHVVDNARLLGSRADELQTVLQSKPVWFESFVQPPGGNLQSYAEHRVRELVGGRPDNPDAARFLIAVSTNPRKWEIRMAPVGRVPGEAARVIGEHMTAGFRRGDYYGSVLTAANQLEALLRPPVAPVPDRAMVPMTKAERAAVVETPESHTGLIVTLIVAFVIGVIVIGMVIHYREAAKERERLEAEQRQRERQAREAQREQDHKERAAHDAQRAADERARCVSKAEASRTDPAVKEAAERAFNRFSIAKREAICHQAQSSPYYTTGSSMDAMNMGHCDQSGSAHTPPPAPEPSPAVASSYSSSSSRSDDDDRRRSSDSYSSPSSYDSGSSSSYDSGSSSSGGGGDW